MLLIGSKAIKYWYPDFPREPKDTDYIVGINSTLPKKEFGIEYLENPIIAKMYLNANKDVIDSNHLTTLKASHLMWNINWDKHMFDLQFLLKKGNKIDKTLFFKLYEFWNEYHSKNKRSDLKMSKEDFFDNAVNYESGEHDFTHTLINPTPIYTKVLKDGCEVELDEDKFHKLSFDEKLDFIREEVYIMAYERWKHLPFQIAYSRMLKKFIISHCPLFALPFVLENYIELHKPKINFIKIINDGINSRHN